MYLRIKEFQTKYGIPRELVLRMLRSEWVNLFAQKISPDKPNSPWIIQEEKAIKMLEEGYWR